MKLIGAGKSKDIYLADNGNIIFEFTDRVTAFDGVKKAEFPQKGMVCCGLAACWFKIIEKEGIPTHFKERIDETRMRVANLKILPVEVIWRNYVAGSLWRRFEKGEIRLPGGTDAREGALIPNGMLEFTTKFEVVDRKAKYCSQMKLAPLMDKDVFRKNKGDLSQAYLEIYNRITKD